MNTPVSLQTHKFMKRNHHIKTRKGTSITKELPQSLYRYNGIQKLSFEKSKKILLDSGFKLTDEEVKEISDIMHKIAELVIKEFISK